MTERRRRNWQKITRPASRLNELAEQGKSILMVSSDREELLGMSERIIVLHEGEQMGELKREEFSQEKVLSLASGL